MAITKVHFGTFYKWPCLGWWCYLPHVFIADEAFTLMENLLKTFSAKTLTDERQKFNYRLSRARRVIENTFAILMYKVLKSWINLRTINVENVMACCVLHNFLLKNSAEKYTPQDAIDTESPNLHETQDGPRTGDTNIASLAKEQNRNVSERLKERGIRLWKP